MATKTTYEVHRLTGSTLIDASGRGYGNESAGVLSRHRTRQAAEREAARLRRVSPTPVEVREVTR
jgi:hypothetical protein